MSDRMCPLGKRSCEFNHMNRCDNDDPVIVEERGKKVCKSYRIKV